MARLKKDQYPEKVSGGYSTIPHSVLDSASFIGASDKARSLILALARQHNGHNNGHLHLAKSWLAKQGYTCPASNLKATKELIERGLIIQTKWGGLNLGANLYALTWHIVSNFVGLEIQAKHYAKGAYQLCKLPPTERRKQPIRKVKQFTECNSASSVSEAGEVKPSSLGETIKPDFDVIAGSLSENNVVIPLPRNNSIKRVVGAKGKSGKQKASHP